MQVSGVYIFCADMVHVLLICKSRINEAQGKSHQSPMLISELFYRASTFLTDFPTYSKVPSFKLDKAEDIHFQISYTAYQTLLIDVISFDPPRTLGRGQHSNVLKV